MSASTNQATSGVSYNPTSDLAKLYNIPTGVNVSGQAIGIIELVGDQTADPNAQLAGYNRADIQTYFNNLNIVPPNLTDASIDGAQNSPNGTGPNGNADDEVELDIEVAGAVAPSAKIIVYFAPNTDQ
jgi:kumamolisin